MTWIGIALSLLLFFVSIILHEVIHYLAIIYYGGKANFAWLHKGTFKRLGNPGVHGEGVKPRDQIMVSLLPIPLGLFLNAIIFALLSYDIWMEGKEILWLLLCVIFSIVATYAGSSNDIKDAIAVYREIGGEDYKQNRKRLQMDKERTRLGDKD